MCPVDRHFIYAYISLLAKLTIYPTDVDVPFIIATRLLSCGVFTTFFAEWPKSRGSIPYRGKRSRFPSEHADLLWFPRLLLYSFCTWSPSPGVHLPWLLANHTPLSSTGAWNEWSYSPTPTYAFMSCIVKSLPLPLPSFWFKLMHPGIN